MRVVDKPSFRPGHCAAIPYLGVTATNERWVDTGAEMPGFDNHVYLSETAVVLAAKTLGLPTNEDVARLNASFDEQNEAFKEAEETVSEQADLISRLEAKINKLEYLEDLFKAASQKPAQSRPVPSKPLPRKASR